MSGYVMTTGSLPSFRVLRELAGQPVAKACIRFRRQQIVSARWDIKPASGASVARALEATRAFRRPGSLGPLNEWLHSAVTDVLEVDALTVFVQRTIGRDVGGWLGSGVAGLAVLDGAMVRPVLDPWGHLQGIAQPWPPAEEPRMVQVPPVPGLAAGSCFYALTDVLYLPRNPRGWSPYGRSPVESAIVRRDGEIDPVATDAAMPGAFGVEFDEDGEVTADRAPFFADGLRAWLKAALFDRVLHDLCKAPDLEWKWTP